VHGVENGNAVRPADDSLTVDGERQSRQLRGSPGYCGIAVGPVEAAPSEKTHKGARPSYHEAVAVVFDLVHPVRANRRLGGAGRDARLYEAVGANREHALQIQARHRAVESAEWHATKSYEARAIMGVRTRGLDMQAGFRRDAADKAARAQAEAVIQRWNGAASG